MTHYYEGVSKTHEQLNTTSHVPKGAMTQCNEAGLAAQLATTLRRIENRG